MPRGGRRDGSGRKPATVRHALRVVDVEADLARRLPQLIELLMAAAKRGDVGAAKYLVDRVLGKPVERVEARVDGEVWLSLDE